MLVTLDGIRPQMPLQALCSHAVSRCAHQGPCLARGKGTWHWCSSCGHGAHRGLPGHRCPPALGSAVSRCVQAPGVKSTLSLPSGSRPSPDGSSAPSPWRGALTRGQGGCLWSPSQPAKWVTKEGRSRRRPQAARISRGAWSPGTASFQACISVTHLFKMLCPGRRPPASRQEHLLIPEVNKRMPWKWTVSGLLGGPL